MRRSLVMLLDYRGYFYSSAIHGYRGMNIDLIRGYFADQGYSLVTKKFREIDFRNDDYGGQYVLYQSSEDLDLQYKSYIEDVLLGLQAQGAILIPRFNYFRAHHNKVFMEILRDLSSNPEIKNIRSKGYGTFEDFMEELASYPTEVVLKPSAGSGSRGIRLLRDESEKRKFAKEISKSPTPLISRGKGAVRPYVWKLRRLMKRYVDYFPVESNHRRKFVIQTFVPDLEHDYKVLVYGRKYYALLRRNRKNDFRASGSGLLEWIHEPPPGLLDYAKSVFNSFDVPYISIDVGFDGSQYYLLEFQFVMFGPLTLERSSFYFVKENAKWTVVEERPILEREFARSVVEYVEKMAHE